ncbi:hypothetical protein G6F43_003301 [Rhizopus delemar]|nr:hypothetical protein G6F43_003301 [Rhizopus delemar]
MEACFYDFIVSYITNGPPENLSLAKFVEEQYEYIAQNSQLNEDFQSIWTVQSRPDWSVVAAEMMRLVREAAPSHATSEVPASSTARDVAGSGAAVTSQQQYKLKKEDKESISKMYAALKDDEMWTLSSGKKVEKQMEAFSSIFPKEHPCHSLIMDPSDPIWIEYFSEEELEEIRNESAPEVATLPVELSEFLGTFEGLMELEELYEHACSFKFHPVEQPDLHWMHQSIMNALSLLFCRYLAKERTESDLLKRVWSFIDTCFDMTDIVVANGERASRASSERMNVGRSLGAFDGIERKKVGTKVDLLFSIGQIELGALEAGPRSVRSSTKSVVELGMKCPKTLKDILVEMEQLAPSQLRKLKSSGFVVAGKQQEERAPGVSDL